MNWFRLYNEFASDPKVQMMSEAMQRRLVMLFCIESSNGIETLHETGRDEMMAFSMRIDAHQLASTKDAFLHQGFINEDWTLRNWGERQKRSDSSTERVRRHRQKADSDEKVCDEVVKDQCNVTVTPHKRTEQSRTEKKERAIDHRADDRRRIECDFDAKFWPAYPRKVCKAAAHKAFVKLKPDQELVERMRKAVTQHAQSDEWQRDGGRFIPHPATWINGKRWDDDVASMHYGSSGHGNEFDMRAAL